jgi:hypothetical protein
MFYDVIDSGARSNTHPEYSVGLFCFNATHSVIDKLQA